MGDPEKRKLSLVMFISAFEVAQQVIQYMMHIKTVFSLENVK